MFLLQSIAINDAWQTVNGFLTSINFQKPTWDLVIIIVFILAAFVYGLSMGRDRILLVLIAIYMALAVIQSAPFIRNITWQGLGENQSFIFQIGIFLFSFLFIFYCLSRSPLLSALGQSQAPGGWWQVVLFSILHVGLLMSIALSLLPNSALDVLSAFTKQIFAGEMPRFYWTIAPIVALMLIRSKKEEKPRFS